MSPVPPRGVRNPDEGNRSVGATPYPHMRVAGKPCPYSPDPEPGSPTEAGGASFRYSNIPAGLDPVRNSSLFGPGREKSSTAEPDGSLNDAEAIE